MRVLNPKPLALLLVLALCLGPVAARDPVVAVPTSHGNLVIEAESVAELPVVLRFSLGVEQVVLRVAMIRGVPVVVYSDAAPGGIENQYVIFDDNDDGTPEPVWWSSLHDAEMTPIPEWKCEAWRDNRVLAALAEAREAVADRWTDAVATPGEEDPAALLSSGASGLEQVAPFLWLVDPATVAQQCYKVPEVGAFPEHWRDCAAEGDYEQCKECCGREAALTSACVVAATLWRCITRPSAHCWKYGGLCAPLKKLEQLSCIDQACEGMPGDPECQDPPDCPPSWCYHFCPIGGERECGKCVEGRVCCS